MPSTAATQSKILRSLNVWGFGADVLIEDGIVTVYTDRISAISIRSDLKAIAPAARLVVV